jgi:transposase
VLLALDETQGPAPDRRVVAERVGTSDSTVYLVAKAFTTHAGRVEEVITRKKRATPPVEPKVTGDVEARVIALACSQPPAGRQRWTLRLLERQVALTEGIPPMDHSTIGRVLKRAPPASMWVDSGPDGEGLPCWQGDPVRGLSVG